MTDTLSVLLIVGAAVLGPIEAQPTVDVFKLPGGYRATGIEGTSRGRHYEARVSNCKATNPDKNTAQCMSFVDAGRDGILMETLPQLCERAMREIGAINFFKGRWWVTTPGESVEVRCVPTPAGYRK